MFIGVALAVLSTAYAQEVNICQGVPDNTFISDVSACNAWFRCTPNGPVPGNNLRFIANNLLTHVLLQVRVQIHGYSIQLRENVIGHSMFSALLVQ